MAREVAKDPWDARLKPIATDKATKGGMPPWLVKSFNCESELADPKTGKPVNPGSVVVRSMWWPGSYTFYNNGRTMSVYVGDGQKNEPSTASYFPVNPPMMCEDRDEKPVFTDSNMQILSNRTSNE